MIPLTYWIRRNAEVFEQHADTLENMALAALLHEAAEMIEQQAARIKELESQTNPAQYHDNPRIEMQ